jgi:hypothetical protein
MYKAHTLIIEEFSSFLVGKYIYMGSATEFAGG